MIFLGRSKPDYELTFADVFLVPQQFSGGSRHNVELTPTDSIGTTLPVVAADMLSVSGRRLAETIARRGGIAVFSHDMSLAEVSRAVHAVKDAHPVYESAPSVASTATVGEARYLADLHGHRCVVVVKEERPIGILNFSDFVSAELSKRVGDLVREPFFLPPGITAHDAFAGLVENEQQVAIVGDADHWTGILTRDGALRSTLYRPALDGNGRLLTAAAVGINGDPARRAADLIAQGVDVISMHTPHAAQDSAVRIVSEIRDAIGERSLVAGVVVTGDATQRMIKAGADVVKVGLGGGAMCTTRMMTGVGRPQFSAVMECAEAAGELGKPVWSDGGVRYPRDVALALAAGASSVMIGSWFCRTLESRADLQTDERGRLYKECYGIASARAVRPRFEHLAELERARNSFFDEGLSTSRLELDQRRLGLEDVIDHIVGGVRSGFTYAGVSSIAELHERAVVGIQSAASYEEGKPLPNGW